MQICCFKRKPINSAKLPRMPTSNYYSQSKQRHNLANMIKLSADWDRLFVFVSFTHIVWQRCALSLSASQRLCCLLQNLVVLFGKQSKQTAGETQRHGKGMSVPVTDE